MSQTPGQNPYYPNPYAPVAVRPPLARSHKRAAFWAGFAGLNIFSLGVSVAFVATVFALILSFVGLATRSAEAADPQSPGVSTDSFTESLNRTDVWVWILVAGIAGVVIAAIGVVVSGAILKARGVRRPWAVTWSSIGISLPVLGFLGFIGSTVGQFAGMAAIVLPLFSLVSGSESGSAEASAADAAGTTLAIVAGTAIVGTVFSVAVIGVVGWLIWWWMTHAFRAAAPPQST